MTQYFYISSPNKLPVGDFGGQPISEEQPYAFRNELDATVLIFEDNYDSNSKDRFNYAPILSFKYQVAFFNNFLTIKGEESGKCYEKKCLQILYEYLYSALNESGVLEYCTCLKGTEEKGDWTRKTIHWGDINSPYDLVLKDREIFEILI